MKTQLSTLYKKHITNARLFGGIFFMVLVGVISLGLSLHVNGYDLSAYTTAENDQLTVTNQYVGSFSETTVKKLSLAGSKLIDILDNAGGVESAEFAQTQELLSEYIMQFEQNSDTNRLAIAVTLKDILNSHYDGQFYDDSSDNNGLASIPEQCSVRFDGCNTCQVMDDGLLACTKIFCPEETIQESYCKSYEKTIIVDDHLEDCVGVGNQQCMRIKESENDDWSLLYDTIEGFAYEEGRTYTLLVDETFTDPADTPADASTRTWTLNEVIAIDKPVPTNCAVWFDGCNTCNSIDRNTDMMACTLMACAQPEKSYCIEFTNGIRKDKPESVIE